MLQVLLYQLANICMFVMWLVNNFLLFFTKHFQFCPSPLKLNFSTFSDSDSESPGWNATISLSFCGGSVVLVTGQNSTIHSPNFPDVYPSSLNCEWIIFAPRGHFVEAMFLNRKKYLKIIFCFRIEHFWLSATENCTSEYLTIRDYNSTGF